MMAGSLNRATLLGNIGGDPDVRSTQNGNKVANFSIATSERWRDRNTGEDREATEWHRVTAFGPLAEIVDRYCRKGDKIMVEGQIKTRKWQDQSGQDRYTTEIVVSGFRGQIHLLGSRNGDRQVDGASGQGASHRAPEGQETHNGYDDLDDEIPF